MDITINRESVCMGDDVENHSITYTVNPDATFTTIFLDLIKQRYFPNIAGNDVVWVLKSGAHDLATWKTKKNEFYSRFIDEEPKILASKGWRDITDIHFDYYSPPIKRAKYIYERFDGKPFHIWHEGFMPEYESYTISKRTEKEWGK